MLESTLTPSIHIIRKSIVRTKVTFFWENRRTIIGTYESYINNSFSCFVELKISKFHAKEIRFFQTFHKDKKAIS